MNDKNIHSGLVRPENIRIVAAPKIVTAKPVITSKPVEEKPKTMKAVFRNDVLDKIHYKAGHIYDISISLYNKLKSVPSAVDHSKSLIVGYKGKLKPLTRNPKRI